MGQIDLDFHNTISDPSDHKLSAHLESDSFVYSVFDGHNALVAHKSHRIDYHSVDPYRSIREDENLGLQYSKLVLVCSSSRFVHLDEHDYDDDHLEAYFSALSSEESLISEIITASKIRVVYPMADSIIGALQDILHPTAVVHFSSALRQYIYPSQKSRFVVVFTERKLHFMCYRDGLLQMYNAYDCRSKEDFLYYLQLATEAVSMDKNADHLELGGNIDPSSDLYKIISPYYRNIDWMHLMDSTLTTDRHDLSPHYYIPTYIGKLCVS